LVERLGGGPGSRRLSHGSLEPGVLRLVRSCLCAVLREDATGLAVVSRALGRLLLAPAPREALMRMASVEVQPPAQDPRVGLRVAELGLLLLVGFGAAIVGSLNAQWHPLPHTRQARDSLDDLVSALPVLFLLVYILRRRGLRLRDIGVSASRTDVLLGLLLSLVGSRLYWPLSHPSLWVLSPIALAGILLRAAKEELVVRAYMMT